MRATLFAAIALLSFLSSAPASHAALGEEPALSTAQTPVRVSVASNYRSLDTTLTTGTRITEYVSNSGSVFAISWSGPFPPDLRSLLGKHFDTMVAESAKRPKAGNSQLVVQRDDLVLYSVGHVRSYEGRAWIPAALPAGFSVSDIH